MTETGEVRTKAKLSSQFGRKIKSTVSDLAPVKMAKKAVHDYDDKKKQETFEAARKAVKIPSASEFPAAVAKVFSDTAFAREDPYGAALAVKSAKLAIGKAKQAAAGIQALDEQFEFVSQTVTGNKVIDRGKDLVKQADTYFGNELFEYQETWDYLKKAAEDYQKDKNSVTPDTYRTLRVIADSFPVHGKALSDGAGHLNAASIRAIDAAKDIFSEQALKAYIKDHPDTFTKALSKGLDGLDKVLEKAGDAAGEFKPIVVLAQAAKVWSDRQVMHLANMRQMEKEWKKGTSNIGTDMLEDKPWLYAQRISQKQIEDLTQALKLAKVFVGLAPPPASDIWEVISGHILEAGEAYYEAPWKKLKKEYEGSKSAKKKAQELLKEKGKEYLEEVALEKGAELLQEGATLSWLWKAADDSMTWAWDSTVGIVIEKAIKKVVKALPNHPAQGVTWDESTDARKELAASLSTEALREKYGFSEEIKIEGGPSQKVPKVTSDGRQVIRLLQKEGDDIRKGIFYVEVEGGEKGKLQQDGAVFTPLDGMALDLMFPTKDASGNRINEIFREERNEAGTVVALRVREGDLAGKFDVKNKTFVPTDMASIAHSDWSNRVAKINSIGDVDTGASTPGKWFRLQGGKRFFFEAENGERFWATNADIDYTGTIFMKLFMKTGLDVVPAEDLEPKYAASVA